MLFCDAAVQYLEKDKLNLSPYTVRTYFWNLKKISDFRPDLECSDLSQDVIREFKCYMQQLGNEPATIKKALSVFRIFTNKMVVDGLVNINP